MTPRQRELVRHALGLPNDRGVSYRRHFVAGPGHTDYLDWVALMLRGDAVGAGATFLVTRQGAVKAVDAGESLSLEDFPDRAPDGR